MSEYKSIYVSPDSEPIRDSPFEQCGFWATEKLGDFWVEYVPSSQWISVEERLPEPSDPAADVVPNYIVWQSGNWYRAAYYRGGIWSSGQVLPCKPSHWMPEPPGPEET